MMPKGAAKGWGSCWFGAKPDAHVVIDQGGQIPRLQDIRLSGGTFRRRRSLVLVFAAVACTFASTIAAENWPRFRGPNGQGDGGEMGIPAAWSDADVAWKIELGGTGHSSPVVWDETVYVTFADTDGSKGVLMAVGASDGAVLWQKEYGLRPPRMNPLNSSAASTPAVDGAGVYGIWYGADRTLVTATDHQGKERWAKSFPPVNTAHGPGGSTAVYGDLVVFSLEQEGAAVTADREGVRSFWYALDKNTGEIRWRLERDNSTHASSSTPCLYPSGDGDGWLIFSSRAHGVTAVDPASGAVVWEAAETLPTRATSSPVVAGDLIVATCGQGGNGIRLVAVRPPGEGSPEARVSYALTGRLVPNVPTPIAVGEWLFLFHDQGLVTCIESRTGTVLWSEKPGGRFFGSPVLVDGRLYCINTSGQVVVLSAGATYERLAVNDLGEASQATPAVAEGRMFLRTLSHLWCIAAEAAP